MKKALHWIMVGLVALLLVLTVVSDLAGFSADVPMAVIVFLLLVAFVFYTCRYAGICCPNCEVRISGKYIKLLNRDGRVFCPRCGAMIER